VDKGYVGICLLLVFCLIPFKKPYKGKLTDLQKKYNRSISQYRIFIEHVNRSIKRFKILKYRYRNKQRKHHLRISLICGIYNYELKSGGLSAQTTSDGLNTAV
jgi:hypothetical protein